MTTTNALVLPSPGARLERTTIERRALRADDVLIDIAYTGICHSDIHQGRDDWGGGIFPMVPGHEIAGTVASVGVDVTDLKPGDRVGVGCLVDSCGTCENCLASEEQFCTNGNVHTYNAVGYDGEPTLGGYSRSIVVKRAFVVRIPETLSLAAAAPLLCCGITTYVPLRRWHAGAGTRVAVLGLGGLGHLAVKIATALGAEVTVLGRSRAKENDALRLGARAYVSTGDPGALDALAGRFDLLLNAVPGEIALETFLPLLGVDGVLVTLGLGITAGPALAPLLLRGRRVLTGSLFGGLAQTQEMLDFCATHGIGADVEVIGADEVDEAWKRVVSGDVRYRFVLDTATLDTADRPALETRLGRKAVQPPVRPAIH